MPRPQEPRLEWIPLSPDWQPDALAAKVIQLTEQIWDEGWVFEKAEVDGLMESVILYFRWP
jgi:hypothetical protein